MKRSSETSFDNNKDDDADSVAAEPHEKRARVTTPAPASPPPPSLSPYPPSIDDLTLDDLADWMTLDVPDEAQRSAARSASRAALEDKAAAERAEHARWVAALAKFEQAPELQWHLIDLVAADDDHILVRLAQVNRTFHALVRSVIHARVAQYRRDICALFTSTDFAAPDSEQSRRRRILTVDLYRLCHGSRVIHYVLEAPSWARIERTAVEAMLHAHGVEWAIFERVLTYPHAATFWQLFGEGHPDDNDDEMPAVKIPAHAYNWRRPVDPSATHIPYHLVYDAIAHIGFSYKNAIDQALIKEDGDDSSSSDDDDEEDDEDAQSVLPFKARDLAALTRDLLCKWAAEPDGALEVLYIGDLVPDEPYDALEFLFFALVDCTPEQRATWQQDWHRGWEWIMRNRYTNRGASAAYMTYRSARSFLPLFELHSLWCDGIEWDAASKKAKKPKPLQDLLADYKRFYVAGDGSCLSALESTLEAHAGKLFIRQPPPSSREEEEEEEEKSE